MENPEKYLVGPFEGVKRLQITICGGPLSGKSTIAKFLAVKYNLTLVPVDKLLSEAINGLDLKTLNDGKTLGIECYIEVIKCYITSHALESKGWILDAFPLNSNQVQALSEAGLLPTHNVVISNCVPKAEEFALADVKNNSKEMSKESFFALRRSTAELELKKIALAFEKIQVTNLWCETNRSILSTLTAIITGLDFFAPTACNQCT